ncbi:MAG: hypothetical protein GY742_16075 [Hyphomicrobiales bacterium]|nr:hypothetical protein [Hyphomicrobiales bacterium]
MTMKRTKEPWMSAEDFGKSIPKGLSVNLLVKDIIRSADFQRDIFGVETVYEDEDFCVQSGFGSQWLLHADHAYSEHPLSGIVAGSETRGTGVEIRLYGCDPDSAEAAARTRDAIIPSGTMDKPHGLRECMIIDDDGYVWVPTVKKS